MIKQYEQEAGLGTVRYLVVDREAMAAEFLAALKETGRTAISVLRTDQYGGLDSFTDIGAFVPLRVSKQGDVLREVAPASIALPLPEQNWKRLTPFFHLPGVVTQGRNQERLDLTERAAAGQSDPEIAAALGCSV